MEPSVAQEILAAAEAGGYLDGGVPDSDDKIVELGLYYFDEARKALAAGMMDEAIQQIVTLGEGAVSEDTSAQGVDPSPAPEPEVREATPEPQGTGEPDDHFEEAPVTVVEEPPVGEPPHLDEVQAGGVDENPVSPAAVQRGREGEQVPELAGPPSTSHRLPVPHEIEGDLEDMPVDLTAISDREVRRLHGVYNAYLARATWLFAQASKNLAAAETMRDSSLRKARREIDRIDPDTEKPKLGKVLDDEAMQDPVYVEWALMVSVHEGETEDLKALKDIYKGNVDRLSREWTMRNEEFQKSGGKR